MSELIVQAVRLLRAGRLVAFPTETVYGLGADATNASAVERIFQAKGRPATNPLIVHVSGVMAAKRYAARWPDEARLLSQQFWPGPLTLVLPKVADIADNVTAGLSTVGLRMPDHPLAIELLRRFEGPIAAPSANRSNHVSPTTAQHVRSELGDAVDLILDGGPCRVGIESTVLDLSGDRPRILRPGGITRQQIEQIIGPVESGPIQRDESAPATSPGQLLRHYAPRTRTFWFDAPRRRRVDADQGGLLAIGPDAALRRHGARVAMPNDPRAYGHHFYAVLRELDCMGLAAIYIELPPDTPEWAALRDRILRAGQPL